MREFYAEPDALWGLAAMCSAGSAREILVGNRQVGNFIASVRVRCA